MGKFVIFLFTLMASAFSGCSYLKAKELPDSGFLKHTEAMQEDRERFPFNKVWLKDYSEKFFDNYTEILIAPVNTDHLQKMSWCDELSLEGKTKVKEDARNLAKYMHKTFRNAVEKDTSRRFRLVESSGPKTLVLEMALVELVPTKAWLNIAGNVAGFFVPGAGTVAGLDPSGSVAIEGRLRDGASGEVVAMFKDHEKDQIAPIGIQNFTWYYHSKDEIDDWAEQFVEVLDTKPDHKVADSWPLTFRIW